MARKWTAVFRLFDDLEQALQQHAVKLPLRLIDRKAKIRYGHVHRPWPALLWTGKQRRAEMLTRIMVWAHSDLREQLQRSDGLTMETA
eukprot:23848-Eustigmatos_ZCMA.PRE.1